MNKVYAIKIRKSDLALITMLNSGVTPLVQNNKTYYVFEVNEDGTAGHAEIISERELLSTRTIAGHSPFLFALKKD